ncbi:Dynein heavy chain 1, axonemal [Heterocephalus glaber]|uniref:Dynein axonemal heavy chain 1 n=1 Tax=Heterocephalus glaber TaxID=10181 RepID=G5BUL8_HETGA|nr:Dynein heavy chain 1, axonemal [Heterocephalus glaber]
MEQQNREGCSRGRTPQPPKCSGAPAGQWCHPGRSLRGLEHSLEQTPDYRLRNPPPGADLWLPPSSPPLALSTPSDAGRLRKSGLAGTEKKYPLLKQRGFYSDILSPGASDQLGGFGVSFQNVCCGPSVNQNFLRQADLDKFTPKVGSFVIPEDFEERMEQQCIGSTTQLLSKTDFPPQADEPKVHVPFQVLPGQRPRKVEIESPPFAQVFDNEEFDCRTPSEWINMGLEPGFQNRKPVPGKALLPTDDFLGHEDPKSQKLKYKWCKVGVLDYDEEKKLYLVHKTDKRGLVRDQMGKPILNGGVTAKGRPPLLVRQYWVPRIQLLFCAEDPHVFTQRVVQAHALRKTTEALLRYNLYVDCMPSRGQQLISEQSLNKIKQWAMNTPRMHKGPMVLEHLSKLTREVILDYERSMNKMSFDKIVSSKPDTFSYVTLPKKEEETVPEKGGLTLALGLYPVGLVSVPMYPFRAQKEDFTFVSLLTRPEVITALSKVRAKCNSVASMSLFHSTLSKYSRLEEFEQIQLQTLSQVQMFLKDSWISTLKVAMRSSLRDMSKGWYNLYEANWEVYLMSKLRKLMETIKYMLQDTLRFLVQDSLASFTQFISDICGSVRDCPEDMVWGEDLMNSPYRPKKNALFIMDLVLDGSGVHYSTPLEQFETSLLNIFDKGILATHSVPQLEKLVMEDLFISGDPLLESVGLHEPLVEELRAIIVSAMDKAMIPLQAYAKEYRKYLELNNSDISNFLEAYQTQCPSAQEVREVVLIHLKEKEVLDNTLPSSIIIGPFYINVDNVKQNLSKKRKTLATSTMDILAKSLHKEVDRICEEFRSISRKIYEKPNSIEELAELRDWMKGIPEKLVGLEERIVKVMDDYQVMDEFFYNLSSDDFNDKWAASFWPSKILRQIEIVQHQHTEDEEKFRKIQIMDQNNFQEKLEGLQLVVAGFSVHMEIARAHEIANEVRRVKKQLKDCQQLATLYNNRARIFGLPITNYEKLSRMVKEFQPYLDLWTTASDWLRWSESWMNDPLSAIDAEQLEKNVTESFKTMHKCVKQFKEIPACQDVALDIRAHIEEFKPYIPLIQGLRNPGMRNRHWDILSNQININVRPKANLTFARCLEMNLQDHIESISKVAEVAGKEYSIEQALDKMEKEWSAILFNVLPYKETDTYILKSPDEASQLLDDHIIMTQSMSFSPYKKPFEQRISSWETKLKLTQEVLEEWLNCQRSWLYLEPIFSSEDITRQLPVESKRYQTTERVINVCSDQRLLDSLRDCTKLLDQVQKGLSEHLESKRSAFPRLYFLSDDELLEILSQTKDPTAVQPHLRKCFENIAQLLFQEDLEITHMYSAEGEEVQLSFSVCPSSSVEDWLREVEHSMKASVRSTIEGAIQAYPKVPRTQWVLSWPGQVTIVGCQAYWTMEVAQALETGSLGTRLSPQLSQQLSDLVALVRGKLTRMQRAVLSALIVIEVHAKEVVNKLIQEDVVSVNAFEWISQLRYYWTNNDLYVRAVNAEFIYGYEYLGNSGRLVITPLTDRCYLTLTGALHLKFGGAPAGPAGTGKTETTKDLGKALAIQTVVFNCSDQLDFMAMGKFFKGLASAGAWACFDEFNRIDIEVLSVVAQQITTIQKAQQQRALFRPVAMMVPDYAMIAEISLYSFGFSEASVLAKKITTTFKLSSEQLSSQDHYDFGMRAVKTVISAAGNLKRENPSMNEELICLRAIRDVNVPKFLQEDLKLFSGIVSDLFPTIQEEQTDYGILDKAIRKACEKSNLKAVDEHPFHFLRSPNHSSPALWGARKVTLRCPSPQCYRVLAAALTSLKGQPSISGGVYEAVNSYVLNPKSITMGQLYGEFDRLTHEWTDGIFSSLIRVGAMASDTNKKWYMFDGPVDAVWIENMNTVLDDNKKLCLSSGEIIKLTEAMTVMFEVQDLAVASPATVSRCGMVYTEPSILGLMPFVECWLKKLPSLIKPYEEHFRTLFVSFLEESISFVRSSVKEVIPSTNGNLTMSLLKLLDCFFKPFLPKEGLRKRSPEKLSRIPELIEPWFIFSLVWSVGATGDSNGRLHFSHWLRTKMMKENMTLHFPGEGLVFDYRLEDTGISSTEDDDEEEEEGKQVAWVKWMDSSASFTLVPDTNYCNIIVPTMDTVQMSYLLGMLLTNHKPDHYDFGMRAVKTVISAAGNLKRENPSMNEELICLRAIRDVNVPKFLQEDLKLFSGIVSDLFPTIQEEQTDYGILDKAIRKACEKSNLKAVDGSGKSTCYRVLAAALTSLKGQPSISGGVYEAVNSYVLNPKSITMGQLYGEFDRLTHEWTDGIFSSLIRVGAMASDTNKKWYMFDGPVDAVWIENMNTVLDDNKKLCLSSGEIIKLTEAMTVMFEVQDLAVASPATVSRCGMVYTEPSILGLMPFVECWLKKLPSLIKPYEEHFRTLFVSFLEESISFVRSSVKEVIPSTNGNLTMSLLKLLDCFFKPFLPKEGLRKRSPEKLSRIPELIEPWFIFSLVWSVGATGDSNGRLHFSHWLRTKMMKENMTLHFPGEGLVFDYRLEDTGISSTEDDDEEEEEGKQVAWVKWMDSSASFTLVPDTNYCNIIVPTMDTVQMSYLLGMLLTNHKPVLCIGPAGTGKTLTISDKLLKNLPLEYISHFLTFSAHTAASQTQDLIDSKLDKRQGTAHSFLSPGRKGVFGPPLGRNFIFFIDDLNMPALETYGAQPPIELLRQWMDHGGWYDRKIVGAFKNLVDINFVCAMGPPGGGRNAPRLTRHFNYLSFAGMDDGSKKHIFSAILGSWIDGLLGERSHREPVPGAPHLAPFTEPLVEATVLVYGTITSQLLPTPAKSHYAFNLRDLSKVFQGMLMADPAKVEDKAQLLRLWYHENCRVFRDRLVSDEDRSWFDQLLKSHMEQWEVAFDKVCIFQPILYGDFMSPGSEVKSYELITDEKKMMQVIEEYMEDYNQINTAKLKLVLFMDTMSHICRISRTLRQALGNALLLGVGGSGRSSLTRLASHMAEYECFQIELSKNYGMSEWREDVKKALLKAGLQNLPITFLLSDTQIKNESFLEDINNILNSGDIPNLYNLDEQDQIVNAMRSYVQEQGLQPTKANLMAAYTGRVRNNIHMVLCMSPIGEVFRARLRQFPSLVNCCTIDWFNEWPAEALESVAATFLNEIPDLASSFEVIEGLIKNESFLEDINNILNSGDIPNLYNLDEQDQIVNAMRSYVQEQGLQPTKANLMAAYTGRVRNNIHMVLCMSPIGEVFRARLRQFPSLVNCCTIDWFNEWPAEALESVAATFLNEIPDLASSFEVIEGLIQICVYIHQSVSKKCVEYLAELARHNYVTPKSYLELLNIFSILIGQKKLELKTAKNRMKSGLDKLLRTSEDVAKMQEELEIMRPLLEEAAKDTIFTMDQIKVDTAIAEETRNSVQAEEIKANEKARKAQAIANDAQKDLDEALPALDAALASLRNLNKNDVTEVRAMQRPPPGVKLVIEAVCIMKGIKPKKVAGDKPGSKVDDYWEPGKGLLQDPGRFLESLFKFDKDNIGEAVIKAIQPYIDNEEFQPAAIAKVSKACTSICQWVRAMHKYHFVAKAVEPKRQALGEAQEDLEVTQRILEEAKQRLREVEDGIATMQAKYRECIAKKEELEMKCEQSTTGAAAGGLPQPPVQPPRAYPMGPPLQLISGLSDEKVRWQETVESLEHMLDNISGNVLIAAGFVAYLGPFTGQYRTALYDQWVKQLTVHHVPHTSEPTLIGTLGNPVTIRSWQIAGLPNDTLSVENGVINQFSQRWTHFIDPQSQANRWIKNMEKDNGLDVFKLSDRDFLRSMENAIRFGKPCLLENVGEELDPALEPVLLKQTYKQQGNTVLKLGDTAIPYHEDFRMYITTRLPNPHYTPEISTKLTLINFTLSPSGLEDQLLGQVVAEERPDLEEAKNQLIISNAKMLQELKDIEDQILYHLSSSEGNPVDDVELIKVLEASKMKAAEIQAKVKIAEQTEKDIDLTRMEYIPVAVRSQILFFCVSDLANVDPMYQYSLEWFLNIFLSGIANSERADNLKKRITNINRYLTYSLYSNVCRSLFEKHKLMFAFLLCVRIMMNEGKINQGEWRYLLSGGSIQTMTENPAPDWLSERAWRDIQALSNLPTFASFPSDFVKHQTKFRAIFDSLDPHREPLPGIWNQYLDQFQKLLVLRCLRGDKVTNAMQDFVATNLEPRFIEPQASADPAADLYKFAEEMKFSKKLSAISLGQGQGPRAEAMMRSSIERGKWVFFQNCHLAPSWMPALERLIEHINPDKPFLAHSRAVRQRVSSGSLGRRELNVDLCLDAHESFGHQVHRDFRLWLTSLPSNKFPVSILQNGSKMTIEPPRGVKANLLKSYNSLSDDFLNSCRKVLEFKSLLLSLCLFHGNALERRKFGALGFNIPYEFTDGDLRICISQLKMFLDEYDDIPYKVLKYTAGEINYGGRVTDDWDRRCVMNILEDFYRPAVLSPDHSYSDSGIYHQIQPTYDLNGYLSYIKSLPLNDMPEIFGLHDNANITFAQNETFALLGAIIQLQPKSSSSGSQGREEIVQDVAQNILLQVPEPINLQMVMDKYPVLYEESMNTVLVQEVIRYNRLLQVITETLRDLLKALKGLVVMSSQLELMAASLYNNTVPELWNSKAYPSLKPLASWVMDLLQRLNFLQTWIQGGIPAVFWISGFFFPQAFLTGTLQNFARKFIISIDIISFDFKVMAQSPSELKERPEVGCYIHHLFLEGARWDPEAFQLAESRPKELYTDMAVIWLLPVMAQSPSELKERPEVGCYIHGLFLEGARWDPEAFQLAESRPKELYTDMAVIWLLPVPHRKAQNQDIYLCPIYKTLTRAGTLSTTGHSTNYVIAVEIPTIEPQRHWIKRGVALICALDY